eukprot:c20327_g1_i1.p1 GENE.c20327_g1_i1~~c20327_g1_i1.p1  ORF type:complete len:333 (-),score=57.27 c20327_g1_i1:86-1084(-)
MDEPNKFFFVMNKRCDALEQTVDKVKEFLQQEKLQKERLLQKSLVPKTMRLVIESIRTKQYTNIGFSFEIRLVDIRTGEVVPHNRNLKITALNANKFEVQKISPTPATRPTLSKGVAKVTGLKFSEVSSKNGGHYHLKCEVDETSGGFCNDIEPAISEAIAVFTCRLRNSQMSYLLSLSPKDHISKLPRMDNIGHPELFHSLKIITISDLASLAEEKNSECRDIIEKSLSNQKRKPKKETEKTVPFTKQKIFLCVQDAKIVCERENNINEETQLNNEIEKEEEKEEEEEYFQPSFFEFSENIEDPLISIFEENHVDFGHDLFENTKRRKIEQ